MQIPHILLLCFLTTTLLSSALIFFLQFRQTRKLFHLLGFTLTIALIPVIIVIGHRNGEIKIVPGSLESKEVSQLQKIGEEIIREIELFRENIGRYPLNFDEANLDPPTTPYGRWIYAYNNVRDQFKLELETYQRDRYQLLWSSENNKWERNDTLYD